MRIDTMSRDRLAFAAAAMRQLDRCPSCGCGDLREAFTDNDLSGDVSLPSALRRSDYRLCRRCLLIFAAWRQTPAAAPAYYQLFAELENRHYAVYPPPASYRTGKAEAAQRIAGELMRAGALSYNARILHVRCDCGSLGPVIRRYFPGATVVGQDYFETNVRFANEIGNLEALPLSPAGAECQGTNAFDVVVANHIFTHALDPIADLRTYGTMLRAGGTLFTYNDYDFSETIRFGGRFFRVDPVNNYHKQLFSPRSLQRLFAAAGYEIIGAHRRRNTISAVLKQGSCAPSEAAGDEEFECIYNKLQTWMTYRSSFKGKLVSWPPIRAALKAFATEPQALPY